MNMLELLQEFNKTDYSAAGITYSFNTFLAVVEKAGLSDILTTGGPYRIYAPTDDAFAALPDGELDALMAHPEALANLLHAHVIEGYYPYGTFSISEEYGAYGRTLKNLLGQDMQLTIEDETLYINGVDKGSAAFYITANGSTVRPLPSLFIPPNE